MTHSYVAKHIELDYFVRCRKIPIRNKFMYLPLFDKRNPAMCKHLQRNINFNFIGFTSY